MPQTSHAKQMCSSVLCVILSSMRRVSLMRITGSVVPISTVEEAEVAAKVDSKPDSDDVVQISLGAGQFRPHHHLEQKIGTT
jgi:hypothetical protein